MDFLTVFYSPMLLLIERPYLALAGAIRRVDMGGHNLGPMYLLVRVPLQLILIGWVYWFAVRRTRTPLGGIGHAVL